MQALLRLRNGLIVEIQLLAVNIVKRIATIKRQNVLKAMVENRSLLMQRRLKNHRAVCSGKA